MGTVEQSVYGTITYNFFEKNNVTYVLIKHDDGIRQLGIMSIEHKYVISLELLVTNQTLKSQLVWDLLEQAGIKYFAFDLLYRGKIPDQSQLSGIDFNDIR